MSMLTLLGSCELPPTTGRLDVLWDDVLKLADDLPVDSWVLVGGQMVRLHGLVVGRPPVRISQDIDLLANLVSRYDSVRQCVHSVLRLGYIPLEANDRRLLHRFIRPSDRAVIDILAPDHAPPRWKATTVPPRTTIKIDGGRQALERAVTIDVTKNGTSRRVPIPSLLGALVLKGRLPGRQPRASSPSRRRSLPRVAHHGSDQTTDRVQGQRPQTPAQSRRRTQQPRARCLAPARRTPPKHLNQVAHPDGRPALTQPQPEQPTYG